MIAPEYEGIKVYLKVLVTRSGNITSQQSIITIKDDNLFWPGVRVGGEVVSEEPGTGLLNYMSRFDSRNCSASTLMT